jgi:hypothetical protein
MPNANFLVDIYPVELQIVDLITIFIAFIVVAIVVSTVATTTMIKRR